MNKDISTHSIMPVTEFARTSSDSPFKTYSTTRCSKKASFTSCKISSKRTPKTHQQRILKCKLTSAMLYKSGLLKSVESSPTISFSSDLNVPEFSSEFQCPFCDKTFICDSMLHYHVLIECQKVSCAICGKSFRSKAEFSDHINNHNIERESKVFADEEMKHVNELRKIIDANFGSVFFTSGCQSD